jgi:beta-lactamase class C
MDWQQFDAAVQAAMQTFGMVGAAVAVVNRQGTVHSQTFGVRDLASGAPVTPNTLFRIGSSTKSMTSLLVATFVDDGTLAWDQPIIDVWPDFRAPTDALTQSLRVRDLLGMDSGLGEPAAIGLHYDYPTAIELLHSLASLPVLYPPYTEWFYTNPVYAAGGYLPLLRQGVAAEDLQRTYTRLMQERVFSPTGMVRARIADDPRPYTDDYATGYAPDFVEGTAAVRWAPIGSFAPTGGAMADLMDMAAFIRLQLGGGVAPSGTRVVSTQNLAECWQPHIDVPPSPLDGPDLVSGGYAMGWIPYTYTNGRRLIWHTGFYDGFGSFISFLPEDGLGLIVLANMSVTSTNSFYRYVLDLLLNSAFGINGGVNEMVVAEYQDVARHLTNLAAQAGPVDAGAIAPFLGYYEHGYRLALDTAGVLRLHLSARAFRVLAMPGGSYIAASGFLAGIPVRFSRDSTGTPQMAIEDTETVRWQSGLD